MTDKTANIEFTEQQIEWLYTLLGCLSEKYLKDMAKIIMPSPNYERFIALYENDMEYNIFIKFRAQMHKFDLEKERAEMLCKWREDVAKGLTESSFKAWSGT